MAKKVTKKVETTEVVETPSVETIVETTQDTLTESLEDNVVIEDLNTKMEQEAKEILMNTIKEASDKNKNEMEKFTNEFSSVSSEIAQETETKNNFLKNFEQSIPDKSESELKDMLEKEIERIDEVIAKVSSENKIPMTTTYWNGMHFDF